MILFDPKETDILISCGHSGRIIDAIGKFDPAR